MSALLDVVRRLRRLTEPTSSDEPPDAELLGHFVNGDESATALGRCKHTRTSPADWKRNSA